jgi:hypothetical protein
MLVNCANGRTGLRLNPSTAPKQKESPTIFKKSPDIIVVLLSTVISLGDLGQTKIICPSGHGNAPL